MLRVGGLLLVGIAWLLAAASCALASEPKYGGYLTIAKLRDVAGLDPNVTTAHDSHRVFELIYSRLTILSPQLLPEPQLAESWEVSEDGQIYVFHLRRNVKFHNGDELTADDVKYTLDRILNPATGSPVRTLFVAVKNIEVLDKYTIRIELHYPFSPLLIYLSIPEASIINKKIAETQDLRRPESLIGTGPFRLAEWVPDSYMKLERNPDYFEHGKPYLDGIIIRIIPEEQTILAALQGRSVDAAILETGAVAKLARQIPGIIVQAVPSLRYLPLFVNSAKPPLNDQRVRMAISLAIDRQALIDMVLEGEGVPTGPIPPSNPYWAVPVQQLPGYVVDLERAKRLLAEAGYPQGFQVTLTTFAAMQPIAEVIAYMLNKVGINVNIEIVEYGIYIERWRKADLQLGLSYNSGQPDPDFYLYRYFHSRGDLTFIHGYLTDPRLDQLLDIGRRETDFEKRREIYVEAQHILAEKLPFVWLFSRYEYMALQSYVQGFTLLATGSIVYLKDVWIEK